MRNLAAVLQNYGISGEVTQETTGPLLQIIEFRPAAGTKLRNIAASIEDIRRELGVSSLRVESGQNGTIAFEVPAPTFETVDFNQIIASETFKEASAEYTLPLCLGVDVRGHPFCADLAKMPHLLIGGTTGSGKSVGLNTFILSLIAARTPADVKFMLIDPKKIEFSIYNNQKYLLAPVVTETDKAVAALSWLTAEMDRRYELFAENMSKNLAEYNSKGDGHLPYIVCVIDEFADLMALDKTVEKDVMRLAQKARASGIHLLLATQRPSVDVVTGVLKANFPTRLAYKTASATDSRTILDTAGAESLIGRGDSLFLAADGELKRIHGAYMSDADIAEMLRPYAGLVKPLPLPQAAVKEENTAGRGTIKSRPKEEPEPNVFVRAWRFWQGLRVHDQKLILNWIKYAFSFMLGYVSNNKQNKKRK